MNNFPILPKEFINLNSDNDIDFCNYLNWTNKHVQEIQFNKSNNNEIPLSFYPIAKNIRIPSSYMVQNILKGKSSFIQNKARNGETSFWENNLKRGSWYPWLWTRNRINGNYLCIDGWKYYFNSFTDNHEDIYIKNDHIMKPPNNLMLFFIYLSCIKYTFQLNESYKLSMNNYRNEMKWPNTKNILAVQIRRGETCTKNGGKTDRPYFSLQQYIEKIELMLKNNNFEYIYISTDSNEEINNIKYLKPDWKLLYLPIKRENFFRMNDNALPTENGFSGTAQDLEDSCRLIPNSIPFIVDTGLADLYFISQCQGYISTITVSEFSRCGWYLQLATQSKLTPYINMNEENIDMNKKDILLLL